MKSKALVACGSFLILGGALLSSCGNSQPSSPSNPTPTATTTLRVNAGVVTTLAGQSTGGSVNATGTSASFSHPEGVAVDASGNVYVADTSNDIIRKISAGANVSTFAGITGAPGHANGIGTSASFDSPVGIAVDSSGNVYVADSANDDIREISTTGVVITLAGTGSTGFSQWNRHSPLPLTILPVSRWMLPETFMWLTRIILRYAKLRRAEWSPHWPEPAQPAASTPPGRRPPLTILTTLRWMPRATFSSRMAATI